MRPLHAVQRAFDLLTCPPALPALDCRGIEHLPQEMVTVDELRQPLLSDATARSNRDQVWRRLVIRARGDGPTWVVAATGMDLPGLRRQAGKLVPGWAGDRADADSEILVGFLERLTTIDLDAANICQSLVAGPFGERSMPPARIGITPISLGRPGHIPLPSASSASMKAHSRRPRAGVDVSAAFLSEPVRPAGKGRAGVDRPSIDHA